MKHQLAKIGLGAQQPGGTWGDDERNFFLLCLVLLLGAAVRSFDLRHSAHSRAEIVVQRLAQGFFRTAHFAWFRRTCPEEVQFLSAGLCNHRLPLKIERYFQGSVSMLTIIRRWSMLALLNIE